MGTVIGKRKGFLRVQFEDGSTKWVDLKDARTRGGEAPPPTPEAKRSPEAPAEAGEEPTMAAPKAPSTPVDPETANQLNAITRTFTYSQQGAFFLNAYWREYGEEAEQIWEWSMKFAELDNKKKNGIALDEVKARQFLQEIGMPMARQAYLDAMRSIDVNNDRKMSLLEFLMFSKNVSPADLLSKPQDGMTDELEKALAKKEEALQRLAELEQEKAELEEVASGTGVKAMQARTQLGNFKKREFDDAQHYIKTAERAITKARKSPELREKGTEFFESRGSEHAKPKKAAKASTMVDGDAQDEGADLHENVQESWREELLLVIRSYNYKQQAGFFLNAYWDEISETAEVLWDYAMSMAENDTRSGEDGCFLDEGQGIQFMRQNVDDFDMTATQFRNTLRTEICLNNDKKMSLVEFLLNQFGLDVVELMTRPQGGNTDVIRSTTNRIKEINKELADWEAKLDKIKKLAAGSGVKASSAKNQLALGYGSTEMDTLVREKEKQEKKQRKAEQSDEITEKGYIWLMERQEQFNYENPQHGGRN